MPSAAGIKAGNAYILIEAVDKTAAIVKGVRNRLNQLSYDLRSLGMQLGLAAGAFIPPLLSAIRTAADTSDSIQMLKAVLKATSREMVPLIGFMNDFAIVTGNTRQVVADAALELAKAGLNISQINDALPSTMFMSRGVGIEMARAAEMIAQTLATFGISSSETMRVADAFVKATNISVAGAEDLSVALSYVGNSAADMGVSLENTLAILGAFSQRGLKGSKAGTSMNQMLSQLAKKADVIKVKLGVDIGTDTGEMRDQVKVLGELGKQLLKIAPVERKSLMNDIFDVRGERGAVIFVNAMDIVLDQMEKMKTASGSAGEQFDTVTEGLGHQVRRILSLFDSIRNAIGDAFRDPLKQVADFFQPVTARIVEWINANRTAFVEVATGIATVLSAAGGIIVLAGLVKVVAVSFGILLPILAGIKTLIAASWPVWIALGAAAVAAGASIGEVWEKIKPTLINLMKEVKTWGIFLVTYLKTVGKEILTALQEAWSNPLLKEQILLFASLMLDMSKRILPFLMSVIVGLIGILSWLFRAFIKVSTILTTFVLAAFNGVMGAVNGLVSVIKTLWGWLEKLINFGSRFSPGMDEATTKTKKFQEELKKLREETEKHNALVEAERKRNKEALAKMTDEDKAKLSAETRATARRKIEEDERTKDSPIPFEQRVSDRMEAAFGPDPIKKETPEERRKRYDDSLKKYLADIDARRARGELAPGAVGGMKVEEEPTDPVRTYSLSPEGVEKRKELGEKLSELEETFIDARMAEKKALLDAESDWADHLDKLEEFRKEEVEIAKETAEIAAHERKAKLTKEDKDEIAERRAALEELRRSHEKRFAELRRESRAEELEVAEKLERYRRAVAEYRRRTEEVLLIAKSLGIKLTIPELPGSGITKPPSSRMPITPTSPADKAHLGKVMSARATLEKEREKLMASPTTPIIPEALEAGTVEAIKKGMENAQEQKVVEKLSSIDKWLERLVAIEKELRDRLTRIPIPVGVGGP